MSSRYRTANSIRPSTGRASTDPAKNGQSSPIIYLYSRYSYHLLLPSLEHHPFKALSSKWFRNVICQTMPLFRFQVQNAPSTPIEHDGSGDGSSTMPPTPTSQLSSPTDSYESAPRGNNRWHNRPRRKGAPRNMEKRPYHSPTHVSPPHDAPMTKNDIYFALDCEVRHDPV